jgi:hypothetical protein
MHPGTINCAEEARRGACRLGRVFEAACVWWKVDCCFVVWWPKQPEGLDRAALTYAGFARFVLALPLLPDCL